MTHSFGACCDVSSQHASYLDCLAGPDVRAADHAVSCDSIVQRAHVNKYRNKVKYYTDVKVNKEYLLQLVPMTRIRIWNFLYTFYINYIHRINIYLYIKHERAWENPHVAWGGSWIQRQRGNFHNTQHLTTDGDVRWLAGSHRRMEGEVSPTVRGNPRRSDSVWTIQWSHGAATEG